jgi:hypothetical protein
LNRIALRHNLLPTYPNNTHRSVAQVPPQLTLQ